MEVILARPRARGRSAYATRWRLVIEHDRLDHRGHHLDRDRVLAGSGGCRKGHGFFGCFVFSLVFFPSALLVAYMVEDRGVATGAAGATGSSFGTPGATPVARRGRSSGSNSDFSSSSHQIILVSPRFADLPRFAPAADSFPPTHGMMVRVISLFAAVVATTIASPSSDRVDSASSGGDGGRPAAGPGQGWPARDLGRTGVDLRRGLLRADELAGVVPANSLQRRKGGPEHHMWSPSDVPHSMASGRWPTSSVIQATAKGKRLSPRTAWHRGRVRLSAEAGHAGLGWRAILTVLEPPPRRPAASSLCSCFLRHSGCPLLHGRQWFRARYGGRQAVSCRLSPAPNDS